MQTLETNKQDGTLTILFVYYSQTGQTEKALKLFQDAAVAWSGQVCSRVICLDHLAERCQISFPWSITEFTKMPAQVLLPRGEPAWTDAAGTADLIVLAYPVWFMCPALPMQQWLRALGSQELAGKPVITISTSRKMWVEAQRAVTRDVEAAGGKVITHIALCDTSRNAASMLSTLHFLLTGRKAFKSKSLTAIVPSFGIDESVYRSYRDWLERHLGRGPWGLPDFFEFNPGLALCEIIGKRIMRFNYLPVRLAQHKAGKSVENVVTYIAASATGICIVVLTPIVYLLGTLLSYAGLLDQRRLRLTSVDHQG